MLFLRLYMQRLIMRWNAAYKGYMVKALIWILVAVLEAIIALWESETSSGGGFFSVYVRRFLLPTVPFMAVFILHDLFLAPLLVDDHKTATYMC